MSPPVTVIGIGNPYRRDDGAAASVLARLAPLIDPAQVRLVELDGEPVRLVQSWEGSRAVWLVDAVRSGRPVGSFHEVAADRLADIDNRGVRLGGGHLLGLGDAVDLARVLDLLPATPDAPLPLPTSPPRFSVRLKYQPSNTGEACPSAAAGYASAGWFRLQGLP